MDNVSVVTEAKNPMAVIFTALRVEYLAVRSYLTSIEEKVHSKGTIYEQGVFSSNVQSWDIGIAEISEGNEQAALEVERAIQYFNPSIILFVGIAGGVKDVKLGDVVVASKVYGYESGKAYDIFRPRPDVGLPNYRMINRAKAEARKSDWLQRLGELNVSSPPDVFIKPIAAGNKVLNSTRSTVYGFIKSNYEDTVAVEMEGFGFLKAAYANSDVRALVIRGISDLISKKEKTDKAGYQNIASNHASAFAFEILAKTYIEPINVEQHTYSSISLEDKTKAIGLETTEAYQPNSEIQINVDKFMDEAGVTYSGSIFGTRITHFFYEKKALAKEAIDILERELTRNTKMKYCVLIDSGTTTYDLFYEICDRVKSLKSQKKPSEETDFWTDRVFIITNNLPGMQYFIKNCKKGHGEYSDLLIKCLLLPGKSLPVYAALVGSETIRFLNNDIRNCIKDELNVKNDSEYQIICFMSSNYMVRHAEKFSGKNLFCPVARGGGNGGHTDIKEKFAELSDKIYIINPLTKFSFATCECLNKINGFYINEDESPEKAKTNPDKIMYREVSLVKDELIKKCNFILTDRTENDLFYNFAQCLHKILRQSYGEDKIYIADYDVSQWMPARLYDPEYGHIEMKTEIPHENLRNAYIQKKQSDKHFIWDGAWLYKEKDECS